MNEQFGLSASFKLITYLRGKKTRKNVLIHKKKLLSHSGRQEKADENMKINSINLIKFFKLCNERN